MFAFVFDSMRSAAYVSKSPQRAHSLAHRLLLHLLLFISRFRPDRRVDAIRPKDQYGTTAHFVLLGNTGRLQ